MPELERIVFEPGDWFDWGDLSDPKIRRKDGSIKASNLHISDDDFNRIEAKVRADLAAEKESR